MENLDFEIMLTNNYYINQNSMHICFPMKIKQGSDKDKDIDADLITLNNFFPFSKGNEPDKIWKW